MDDSPIRRRLSYRAWHRGTRDADYIMGGFFDRHGASLDDAGLAWFARLIEEQDVDILAWATGQADPPAHIAGPCFDLLRRLDFIDITR